MFKPRITKDVLRICFIFAKATASGRRIAFIKKMPHFTIMCTIEQMLRVCPNYTQYASEN